MMPNAWPSEGMLWVCSPRAQADQAQCLREASEAYQRARSRFETLTLAGFGGGAAYCLMLAARFMPERVLIAPFADGEIERFFRLLRDWQHRLFAVCAEVEFLIPADASLTDRRRIHRLMRLMYAADKQLCVLSGEREIVRTIKIQTNSDRMIKTLA